MDAQSSGSVNQTQNPQTNAPAIFAQTQGVQAGTGGSFDINTSSATNGVSISTLPAAASSVVQPAAPKKNYAPLMITGGMFVVIVIASVIFMRAAKNTVY